MPTGETTRRHFTEAARDAAASARQRKREHKAQFPEEHQLVMVVVRAADGLRGFAWQIRRFGHMEPVAQSVDMFRDPADAGRLGQMALDGMRTTLASDEGLSDGRSRAAPQGVSDDRPATRDERGRATVE